MLSRMPKGMPDHHDAELALRVYELRRDPVMRESRGAINQKFWPKAYDDVKALTKADHPLNAAYRQVGSYWEMVYGFAKHGIVHPEFWLESNGEGLFVFAKIAPYLEAFRKEVNPAAYRNAEWVSKESAEGQRLLAMFTERVRKALAARSKPTSPPRSAEELDEALESLVDDGQGGQSTRDAGGDQQPDRETLPRAC